MRLKSLEIQGFKSFPDRTKLEFNDGITAVIGPNGSGKSNIADAIRWVLGEQSSRTLRGAKMEDVIFGGTQRRKSQGLCSVVLTVDNTDRSLPFELDEVSINRKLYRSGESEYRINGTAVRLKDIYELFMDTGLGRDGYSIIGQGRVAEIVSAKSKERREIFEEAAGISKFRYRKTEAERKLNLAEDNILRLKDILNELAARLEPLRKDAQKAEKFVALSNSKKDLEVSYWLYQLSKTKERLHSLEDSVLLKKQAFESAKNEAEELERQTGESHEEMQRILIEIDDLQNSIATWQRELSEAQSTRAVLENDIAHNERTMADLRDTLSQNTDLIGALGRSIEEITLQSNEKQVAYAKLSDEIEALCQLIESNTEQSSSLEEQLSLLRQQQAQAQRQSEAARLAMTSSTAVLKETEGQLERFMQELAVSEDNITQIQGEIKDAQQLLEEIDRSIGRSINEIKGYQLKKDSKARELATLNGERNELMSAAGEKRQRAKLLSDMDKNMEGFGNSVKYVMSQSRAGRLRGVHGPVSSLINVAQDYTTAIEIALGGGMQNIVVDHEAAAKAAIQMLTSSKSGRATFLPITAVKGSEMDTRGLEEQEGYIGLASSLVQHDPQYKGIIANLLGRTVVATDLDSGVEIAKKNHYRFRIVTLDGQLINSSGSMTGGYIAKSAGILGRQGEIDRFTKEAQALEAQAAKLEERIAERTRELRQIEHHIEIVTAQSREYSEDKIRYQAEHRRLTIALEQAIVFGENAKQEHQAILDKIAANRQSGDASRLLLEGLEQSAARYEAELMALISQKQNLNQQATECIAKQNELTTQQLLCKRDIEQLAEKRQEASLKSSDNDRYRKELEDKITLLTEQNTEIRGRIQYIAQNKGTILQKIEESTAAISSLMRKRNSTEQAINMMRSRQKEIERVRDVSYRELVQQEEAKTAVQAQCNGFVSSLWEEYELSLSQAQEIAKPISDPAGVNRELLEIRSRIKTLGSVNLGAIEEYKEVSERHSFLEAQLKDVEKSKQELLKMIAGLTEQMCEIFTSQFEMINKNFQRVFVELFGGGKASLTLTEPENILESGIEISVQPPGKLIKNLSALSGGEQAFVAIAIFFAILKVNPSPFCLMDEIEAALDDVNVAKFASYLRGLCDSTQFIAITHRRGTMEEADVLYGVTMQEDGISKLLELKVNEIAGKYGVK